MNIYNLIILDESGSMRSIENQAVTSMNETIQTIRNAQEKNPEQKQFVTLISFSGSGMEGVKVIRDKAAADLVKEISSEDYCPSGCTPLYDAMGFGITSLDKTVSSEDLVLVTIITDGMENASHIYRQQTVARLVEEQRRKGWTFAYIGANQDSVEVAREMNIKNALNFDADERGTEAMCYRLNRSQEKLYKMAREKCGAARDLEDFFKED